MAKLSIDGMEEAINDLEKLGKNTDEVTTAMLRAGGNVMAEEWRAAGEKHHHRDTGQLIASISPGRKIKGQGNGKNIVVTAQGTDHKGVRNMEKAFILHFGKKGISASHWVDEAEKSGEATVATTMQGIWDEYIETGTVRQVASLKLGKERRAAKAAAMEKYHGPGRSAARGAANTKRAENRRAAQRLRSSRRLYAWEK